MDNNEIVSGDTQTPAEPTVQTTEPQAQPVPQTDPELVKKNQELFARAKKAEEELRSLKTNGDKTDFDSSALEKKIEERVNLRMAGHSPEEIAKIEAFAKGSNVSLGEAANDPFVQAALAKIRSEQKSLENTPAPSEKIKVFNGKPVDQIFKEGSPDEKQAAFLAKVRGGVKSNE